MNDGYVLTPPPLKRHLSTSSWAMPSQQQPNGNSSSLADAHAFDEWDVTGGYIDGMLADTTAELDEFIAPEHLGLNDQEAFDHDETWDRATASASIARPSLPRRSFTNTSALPDEPHAYLTEPFTPKTGGDTRHAQGSSATTATPFYGACEFFTTPKASAPSSADGMVGMQSPHDSRLNIASPAETRLGISSPGGTATAMTRTPSMTSPLKRQLDTQGHNNKARPQECGVNPYYSSPWQFGTTSRNASPASNASLATPLSARSSSSRHWPNSAHVSPAPTRAVGKETASNVFARAINSPVDRSGGAYASPYAHISPSAPRGGIMFTARELPSKTDMSARRPSAEAQMSASMAKALAAGDFNAASEIAAAQAVIDRIRPAPALQRSLSVQSPLAESQAHLAGSQVSATGRPAMRRSQSMVSALSDAVPTRSASTSSRSTADDKQHVCEVCERSFKRLEHLRRHSRLHTGVKEFVCQVEGCGRSFARADNLQAHERTHAKPNGRERYKGRGARGGNRTPARRGTSGPRGDTSAEGDASSQGSEAFVRENERTSYMSRSSSQSSLGARVGSGGGVVGQMSYMDAYGNIHGSMQSGGTYDLGASGLSDVQLDYLYEQLQAEGYRE